MQHGPLGIAQTVVLDQTESEDYNRLVSEEIEHYSDITVTDGLTEGGVHSHKSWEYYFDYLYTKHFKLSFYEAVWKAARGRESPKVLSLGCGYGGHDLEICRKIERPFELFAVDLNPRIYDTALERAQALGLPIRFQSLDLNRVELEPGYFDVIYAVASIHHILNLEHLLAQLHRGLKDDGRLVIVDIIGKTQVEFWRENVEYAAKVVKRLPVRFRPAAGTAAPAPIVLRSLHDHLALCRAGDSTGHGGNPPGRDRAASRSLVSTRRKFSITMRTCG